MSRNVVFEEVFDYEAMQNTLNILHPLYQQYGWTWTGGVPDRDRLESSIKRLVQTLIDSPDDVSFIASGRLIAYWSEKDYVSVALDLSQFYLGNN